MSEDDLLTVILKLSQNIGNFSPLYGVTKEPSDSVGADTGASSLSADQPSGLSGKASSSGHLPEADSPPDTDSSSE